MRCDSTQDDPFEHVDLASSPSHSAKLASMQQLLADLNHQLFLPGRGDMSTDACLVGLSKGGYYGPFVDAGTCTSRRIATI